MTSVLKPEIASILNGFITVNILSVSQVSAIFDQLLIFRATATVGPFTQLTAISLSGASSETYLDTGVSPDSYYKAQFFNSSTMITSQFSELAQETGVFSEFTVPVSTATYPPEIALSEQDREIVESLRVTLGDMGAIERDYFDADDHQGTGACRENISAQGCTWELSEPRGWPRSVILNGVVKTSLSDPLVVGYKYLTFSGGTSCITGTLDVMYNHFRFADRELLLAYDRARNLLTANCTLSDSEITTEMLIMQAAILLLEGELRDLQSNAGVRIRDGSTEYDSSYIIGARTQDLTDLKNKLKDLIACITRYKSYRLEGVRID